MEQKICVMIHLHAHFYGVKPIIYVLIKWNELNVEKARQTKIQSHTQWCGVNDHGWEFINVFFVHSAMRSYLWQVNCFFLVHQGKSMEMKIMKFSNIKIDNGNFNIYSLVVVVFLLQISIHHWFMLWNVFAVHLKYINSHKIHLEYILRQHICVFARRLCVSCSSLSNYTNSLWAFMSFLIFHISEAHNSYVVW